MEFFVRSILSSHLQAALGVIDECAQFTYLSGSEFLMEELSHFALDVAACVPQDVQKSLVLAVDVGHEMFGTLGQIQNGLQVDNLSTCAVGIGKGL